MNSAPFPIVNRQVPRRVLHGQKLSDTVDKTEKYVTARAQFDQQYFSDIQTALTSNTGQASGGIVNAADLATRVHPYQYSAAIAPHVGDQPRQPSATYYDGPLDFGSLPAGVNATYGYARWTGWLKIAVAGVYAFNLVSVGGANLFVNQTQLIGGLTAASTSASANATLAVGMVPVIVEWQWSTTTPALALKWTPPGGSSVLIPADVMSNSLNQVSGYLLGYYWNGSAANWHP